MEEILRKDIEYVVHCEEDGTFIGPISKKHAHLPGIREKLTHFSTWSMVFDIKTGKYGIQQKNSKKGDKFGAGKWDMGVAGHNCYILENGEYRYLSFEENLVKEADEEIGIELKMFEDLELFIEKSKNIESNKAIGYIFDKFHYKTEINNEWVGLGLILTNSIKTNFKDGEVINFKWFTPEELEVFLDNSENNFLDTGEIAFRKAEKFRKNILKLN